MTSQTMLQRLRTTLHCKSDADLARRLDVYPSEVSKIVNGKRQDATRMSFLQAISHITDIPLLTLVEWYLEGIDAFTRPPETESTSSRAPVSMSAIEMLWHSKMNKE